jgi:acetolactate synthase-1/2/3 large subunit
MRKLPKLEVIGCQGVGVDAIDLGYARTHNVIVTNTPDVLNDDVADIALVLNNFGDGMVMQWQRLFFKGRLSASDKSLRKKDFVKAAQADGFGYAKRLDDKAQVAKTLDEFLNFKGPAFLEVLIDVEAGVYPMVGPGLPYSAMITGDFIPNRNAAEKPADPDKSEMF